MTTPLRGYLALSFVDGIGPIRYRHLVDQGWDPVTLLQEHPEQIERVTHRPLRNVNTLWQRADEELEKAQSWGAQILAYPLPEYPDALRPYESSPPILYVWGNREALSQPGLAIVGSRRATAYGKRIARFLATEIAQRGLSVISGGARGIDTVAHRAALATQGTTVVVLGSGLDRPYPAENRKLFQEVAERGGCVVTEFPFGTKPHADHFPQRNRIISGLAMGVIVVEAGETSGALITARWAADQGKEVFAVPGPMDSPMSRGTHRLIQMGAHLVAEPEDIFQELGLPTEKPEPELPLLSAQEKKVFAALGPDPTHLDTLAETLQMPPFELLGILLALELKGVIQQLPGKFFVRNPQFAAWDG